MLFSLRMATKQLNTSGGPNRFKFSSFFDRLKALDVDVTRKIARRDDGNSQSHFLSTLAEWKELNCTAHFVHFVRQISQYSQSYNQVVFHVEKIVDILLEHLNVPQSMASEPLIKLVTALADDLRDDFYPYFSKFVQAFIFVVRSAKYDPPTVEIYLCEQICIRILSSFIKSKSPTHWMLVCFPWARISVQISAQASLSRLFLCCRVIGARTLRYLIHRLIEPLLKDNNEIIRNFAASGLAFLVRNMSQADLDEALALLCTPLADQTYDDKNLIMDGKVGLLFEVVKGPGGKFHSRTQYILHRIFRQSIEESNNAQDASSQILIGVFERCVRHCGKESAVEFFDILSSVLSQQIDEGKCLKRSFCVLACLAKITKSYQFKNLKLHDLVATTTNRCCGLSIDHNTRTPHSQELMNMSQYNLRLIAEDYLRLSTLDKCLLFRPTLESIFELCDEIEIIQMSRALLKVRWNHFTEIIIPFIVKFMESRMVDSECGIVGSCCLIIEIFEAFSLYSRCDSRYFANGKLVVGTGLAGKIAYKIDVMTSDYASLSESAIRALSIMFRASLLIQTDEKISLEAHSTCVSWTLDKIGPESSCFVDMSLLPLLSYGCSDPKIIDHLLLGCPHRIGVLQSALFLLKGTPNAINFVDIATASSLLFRDLKSPLRPIRILSLEILLEFAKGSDDFCIDLLNLCRKIEDMEDAIGSFRQKLVFIRKIEAHINAVESMSPINLQVIPNFLIGQLTVNFQPLWDEVSRVLMSFGNSSGHCSARAQNILYDEWWSELSSGNQTIDFGFICDVQKLKDFGSNDKASSIYQNSSRDSGYYENYQKWIIVNQSGFTDLISSFRFDRTSFEQRLLKSVTDHGPHIAMQNAATIFRFFLDNHDNKGGSEDSAIIWAWLELFAKFKASVVGQIDAKQELESYLVRRLASGNQTTQKKSLECLINLFSTFCEETSNCLRRLVDNSTFREEIINLPVLSSKKKDIDGHFVQLCVRIMFGRLASRTGSESPATIKARNHSILTFLCSAPSIYVDSFMCLYLKPMEISPNENVINLSSPRRVHGFLKLLQEILRTFKTKIVPFLARILTAVMKIFHDSLDYNWESETGRKDLHGPVVRILFDLFDLDVKRNLEFDFTPYLEGIVNVIVMPRIAKFAAEHAHQSSFLLELLCIWSKKSPYVEALMGNDGLIINSLFQILQVRNVKKEVIERVLDVAENIISYNSRLSVSESINLQMQTLLFYFKQLIADPVYAGLRPRIVQLLASFMPMCSDSDDLRQLITLLLTFLRSGPKVAPENVKESIVSIISDATPMVFPDSSADISASVEFESVCRLLAEFDSRSGREMLVSCMKQFALIETPLQSVADLIADLNSWGNLDSPNWDLRISAYQNVQNIDIFRSPSNSYVAPILYQLIYDTNHCELAIRTSAASTLKRLIDDCCSNSNGEYHDIREAIFEILVAAVKRGVTNRNESRRREWIIILKKMVVSFADKPFLTVLAPLLAGGDDEACFFSNVVHLQLHRRSRALRKLCAFVQSSDVPAWVIKSLLLPIATHFIFGEHEKKYEVPLVDAAILTVGILSGKLSWTSYYSLVKHYRKLMKSSILLAKPLLRTYLSILDNIPLSAEHFNISSDEPLSEGKTDIAKILDTVQTKMLPDLFSFLQNNEKCESDLAIRVPVAVTYAQVLRRLPAATIQLELPRLVLSVVQILKSRSQEVRDKTRDSLGKLAAIVGPKYVPFLVRQLVTLNRGFEKHVASFSLWSLISANASKFDMGDIDPCIDSIIQIIREEIFGAAGEEKGVHAINVKVRESKTTKSFETIEMVTKICSVSSLERFIMAFKHEMSIRHSRDFSCKIRETFKHFVKGVTENSQLDLVGLMMLILNLITESGDVFAVNNEDCKEDPNGRKSSISHEIFQSNSHLFVELGLGLLAQAIKTSKLYPSNPDHVSLLDPFVLPLKDLLSSSYTQVSIQCFKIFNSLFPFKLPSFERYLVVVLEKSFVAIKNGFIDDDLAQASLKTVTNIVREYQNIPLKEKHVVFLIEKFKSDVTETDKSSAAVSLFRAIICRKLLLPELYDLMEEISTTAVVWDQCRSLYLKFLLEYPQSEKRLQRQINGLVKNLAFVHEMGRESVLLLIKSLIQKLPNEYVVAFGRLLFVALMARVMDDEAVTCRSEAKQCILTLFNRMSIDQFSIYAQMISVWLDSALALKITGITAISLIMDSKNDKSQWVLHNFGDSLLQHCAELFAQQSDSWHAIKCSITLLKSVLTVDLGWSARVWALLWSQRETTLFSDHPWILAASFEIAKICAAESGGVACGGFFNESQSMELLIKCHIRPMLIFDKVGQEFFAMIVENLVYLTKSAYHQRLMRCSIDAEQKESFSLFDWIVRRMVGIGRQDPSKLPSGTDARRLVLAWLLQVIDELPTDAFKNFVDISLGLLCRLVDPNINTGSFFGLQYLVSKTIDEATQSGSQKAIDMLTMKLGSTVDTMRTAAEIKISQSRAYRKEKRVLEVVADPEKAARRKISRNKAKTVKRKTLANEHMKRKTKLSVKKVRNMQ